MNIDELAICAKNHPNKEEKKMNIPDATAIGHQYLTGIITLNNSFCTYL